MTAREAALVALERFRRDNAFSDAALDALIRREKFDRRDAALAQTICLGVLQNRALLDFYIDTYSSIKTQKLEPKVLDILRLSVYQLAFLDKIPQSAATNEGVALCKKHSPRAAGLVNAVLRRVAENRERLPEPAGKGTEVYLSIKYSHPVWLVRELVGRLSYGEAEEVLRLNNTPAPVTLQANTLKIASPEPLILNRAGNPAQLPEFQRGDYYVQDSAAKLAALAGDPKPGQNVLDICAAPGGKSFAIAIMMQNSGRILACDIHKKKLRKIEESARRLSVDIIETREMDAGAPDADLLDQFDLVLADAPCSGLGVIRKKPEIRYKPEAELKKLPEVQLRILRGAALCVKPGGALVYATCTWRKAENEDVVGAFLGGNNAFILVEERQLWPHTDGTDGFFICKLKKLT